MKLKYIKSSCLAILLGALAVGCQDNDPDDIFGDQPNVRIEKARSELNNALQDSEYGWKFIYFTDDKQLGGFNHVMKFSGDDQVTMVSDFDNSTLVPKVSSYTLPLGSTLSLLFATPNHIHELGKGDKFPTNKLVGKGYLGDNQFSYYGYDGESISLKGNRGFVEFKLVRATADDWVLNGNQAIMNDVFTKRKMLVVEGTNEITYNFSYNKTTRWALILNDAQTASVNSNAGVGLGFEKDGIIISPAIEFEDGSKLSELKKQGNMYIGTVGTNTVMIM